MLKITIEGKQGSGKTMFARIIMAAAEKVGKRCAVIDGLGESYGWTGDPEIIVETKDRNPRVPKHLVRRKR